MVASPYAPCFFIIYKNDVYRVPFDTCFNNRFYIFLFQILCLDSLLSRLEIIGPEKARI